MDNRELDLLDLYGHLLRNSSLLYQFAEILRKWHPDEIANPPENIESDLSIMDSHRIEMEKYSRRALEFNLFVFNQLQGIGHTRERAIDYSRSGNSKIASSVLGGLGYLEQICLLYRPVNTKAPSD